MTNQLSATEIQNAAALSAQMLTQDKAQAYEAMGMIKAFGFVEKLLTVSSLKVLSNIKKTKQYNGLIYTDQQGKVLTVSSWEGFCQACGLSYKTVDENIINLNTLGEDFLETSQRIGLGYRDLRKLRKLPENERDLIINGEAIKAKDKDELVELIEERAIAHAKEKETLQKQLSDLKADAQAKETILNNKNKKIDELSAELEKKAEKIKLDSNAEHKEQLASFQVTWVDISKMFDIGIYDAQGLVAKLTNSEDGTPYSGHYQFAGTLTTKIAEIRDKLNNLLEDLPSDTGVIDTGWLTEDKEEA